MRHSRRLRHLSLKYADVMGVAGVVVMQSTALRRRARLARLVLAASLILAGCGGRASSGRGNESGGGGSPVTTPATSGGLDTQPTAGTPTMPDPETTAPEAPNSVSLIGNGASAVDQGATADTGLGSCFRGCSAVLDGTHVGLIAFVQEPGEYKGDSVHILFAQATTADGQAYVANAGTLYDGDITLHVSSVLPRFVGTVQLLLVREGQPEADPLNLSLAFDVLSEVACGA